MMVKKKNRGQNKNTVGNTSHLHTDTLIIVKTYGNQANEYLKAGPGQISQSLRTLARGQEIEQRNAAVGYGEQE